MSSHSHSTKEPKKGRGIGLFFFFFWHGRALLFKLPLGAHIPFSSAVLLALTPDLPPAIFFNTRVKWEGTNHCNYVQWLLPWWLRKERRHDGPFTVCPVTQTCLHGNDFGFWAHWTHDGNNSRAKLMSRTCNCVSPLCPNGITVHLGGVIRLQLANSPCAQHV